jgi:RimJ/RimL family protein N-acetyltransferase
MTTRVRTVPRAFRSSLEYLRSSGWWVLDRLDDLWHVDRLVLLVAERPPSRPTAYHLVERTGDVDAVVGTCRAMSRAALPPARFERRFAHGLRYFELRDGSETIATTFIIWRGTRFVDELGLHLPVPEHSIWIRDVFVSPTVRGRGVFEQFFDALLGRVFPDVTTIWSDTESSNAASLRAHAKYGFRVAGHLRALTVAGAFLWRREEPGRVSSCDGYRARQRFLRVGSEFKAYRARYLA